MTHSKALAASLTKVSVAALSHTELLRSQAKAET